MPDLKPAAELAKQAKTPSPAPAQRMPAPGRRCRPRRSSSAAKDMADPGPAPRDAPDIASLWSILDLTPDGRPAGWYPKLQY